MAKVKTGAVGANPPRTDGDSKVTGNALYFDDIDVDGVWHGVTVRSPHAKAKLVGLDVSAVRDADDAVVVTAADLPKKTLRVIEDDWPVLVDEVAQHVGEAVCLIAAPTRERALELASEVEMTWEVLEPILGFDAALAGDPRSGGQGPLELATCSIDHGDLDAGFAEADHVVAHTYETGHQEHIYIENQGMIGTALPDGALDFVGSMQCPYYVHHAMIDLFGLEADQVRVRQAVTGGGFGGKEDYPDMLAAHCALLQSTSSAVRDSPSRSSSSKPKLERSVMRMG